MSRKVTQAEFDARDLELQRVANASTPTADGYPGYNDDCTTADRFAAAGKSIVAAQVHENIADKFVAGPRWSMHLTLARQLRQAAAAQQIKILKGRR
jgi:hypothetical protein